MATHIGLLRAVNLGAYNKIGMQDLRDLVTGLGLKEATTLLQSGNVVFAAASATTAALEQRLEAAARKKLNLDTDFFVRTAAEWAAVVDDNPFPDEAARDPGHLLVLALKEAPANAAVKALQAAVKGREIVRAKGRHAYIVYPDGVGRSRLTSAVIEKALGTRGTGRNWNTVLKLHALTRVK